MTVYFIHGIPETYEIWLPLQKLIKNKTIAIKLPGFGNPKPNGFTGTKDNFVKWLVEYFKAQKGPIDIVGHDIGALFTMRIISSYDVPIRSWVADVGPIFHPDFEWPEQMKQIQKPGIGEKLMDESIRFPPDHPRNIINRLNSTGIPKELASKIAESYNQDMVKCILDFYRSANPNVAYDWWHGIKTNINSKGLILLLPDPPEDEQKSIEVAKKLHAKTMHLDNLNHAWMTEAPDTVAKVLENFWTSI